MIYNDDDYWLQMKSFFDLDFNGDHLKGKYTRIIGLTGAPIDVDGVRYSDKVDRSGDQDDAVYDRENAIMERVEEDIGPMDIMMFSDNVVRTWAMD